MANTERRAYVITGPTSGIGRAASFEVAKHGTVVLVGRSRERLAAQQAAIKQRGGTAITVVCDLSDMESVRAAAREIVALGYSIVGLLNNAGVSSTRADKSAHGWDLTFATNYLGPFALTEALIPHLPDGARVVFVASAVEDPERKPAKLLGMKGGRYLSAEASAHGEWKPGGAKIPGADAYATSKQCLLAAAFAFARETPRLRFDAVEPGITPGTGLGREANPVLRYVFGRVLTMLPPFRQFRSTPERAGRVLAEVPTSSVGTSGVYYDENGKPMMGSVLVRDVSFQDRVVAETRALLGVG